MTLRTGARVLGRLTTVAGLVLAAATASAQISAVTQNATGSSGSPGNNVDGSTTFGSTVTLNTGTSLQTRHSFNVNADIGALSTRDQNGTAVHNVSFSATAPGGYRLDLSTNRVGDLNRNSDVVNCDGNASMSGMSASATPVLTSGSLAIGTAPSLGVGGSTTSSPFSHTATGTLFRVSNNVAQSHSFSFSYSASTRSNSCEAAVRVGGPNATTTDCSACGYPGSPSRTQSSDGLFFNATFTSLCGNSTVDGAVGEQCDLGAANGSATSCCTAQCTFRALGQVCRVGGGAPCDLNETCTGGSGACPANDAPGNLGDTCRVGSGDLCDPDELCNGVPGVACPANAVSSSSTLCRAGSGDVCDPAEFCTGIAGQACPANVVNGGSTVCRPGSGDACDTQETCSGVAGATCPPDDAPLNAGVVCRGGSGDACDQNEACTGTPGAICPPDDAPGNAGVVCRPSSVHGAFCDDNELCSGVPGALCPPNDAPLKVNVVCRPGSGDLCDPDERCTGIANQGCPADVVASPTTVCRTGSGDACDPNETCTAIPGAPCPSDTVTPAGAVCRPASGTCDVAEDCSGVTGQACPANGFAGAGTSCEADADLCTIDECNGSGGCVTTSPVDCDDGNVCTQDRCNPLAGCEISGAPSTSCLPAVKAKFQVKDSPNDSGDRLKFDWKGGPVLLGDLGDPLASTLYELCVYDDGGIEGALGVASGAGWNFLGSATAPKGYKFKDNLAAQDGVKQITLKASSLDKAKLKFVTKGPAMPDGFLPLDANVTAQLYADGMCWEATFGPAETKRSDSGTFSGRTPAP